VADRGNSRVQIFNQDGRFLDQWRQFGRPRGIYIDKKDNIYVADSQSNAKQNPGFRRGIYMGSAKTGKVSAMIPSSNPILMLTTMPATNASRQTPWVTSSADRLPA
jgi:hypothetical protein